MYGLQVDADRALRQVNLFFKFFLLISVVYWLFPNTVSILWRGAPMGNKLPAAVATKPSRFGTRNLEIASRRWPATRACTFFKSFFVSVFLLIRVLTSHNYRVMSVAWSKDGKLASSSCDETVKIWSVGSTGTFECESTLIGHSDSYVFFMTVLEKNKK